MGSLYQVWGALLCRIPAGATERLDFFVTPLKLGQGIADPAIITYKQEQGASQVQVCALLTAMVSAVPGMHRVGPLAYVSKHLISVTAVKKQMQD